MAEPDVLFMIPNAFYLYKDGSVHRSEPPPAEPGLDGVLFRDATLNAELGLWARLFFPTPLHPHKQLPLLLFFHGGGFILGSPARSHSFCRELAKRSGFLCVSASYRLAPEHPLPTGFDDAFAALQWLHSQSLLQSQGESHLMDPWLARADFSKCVLMGVSAGGNIAHRVAMRAVNKPLYPEAWLPLCIRGLVPIHPGFVRQARTEEEEASPFDGPLTWRVSDMCAQLALPSGATKDHPFVNPLPELTSAPGGTLAQVFPKTLVALAEKDRLHFMGLEYARALKEAGCCVDVLMSHDVGHCFFSSQPNAEQAEAFFQRITKFICEEC